MYGLQRIQMNCTNVHVEKYLTYRMSNFIRVQSLRSKLKAFEFLYTSLNDGCLNCSLCRIASYSTKPGIQQKQLSSYAKDLPIIRGPQFVFRKRKPSRIVKSSKECGIRKDDLVERIHDKLLEDSSGQCVISSLLKDKEIKSEESSVKQFSSIDAEKQEELVSFIRVSVLSDLLTEAHSLIQYMVHNTDSQAITHPDIFNLLLLSWAHKGNLNMMTEVKEMMDKVGIDMNLESYAAVLLCCSQMEPDVGLNQVPLVLLKIKKKKLDIKDLSDCSNLSVTDLQDVINLIKHVYPKFTMMKLDFKPYSGTLLQTFNNPSPRNVANPLRDLMSIEELENKLKEQEERETNYFVTFPSAYRKKAATEAHMEKLEQLTSTWERELHTAFVKALSKLSYFPKKEEKLGVLPYLKVLEPSHYVSIMMKELRVLFNEKGSRVTYMQRRTTLGQMIMNAIQEKFHTKSKIKDMLRTIYKDYLIEITKCENPGRTHREIWRHLCFKHAGIDMVFKQQKIPSVAINKVGFFLYELMMKNLKIDVEVKVKKKDSEEKETRMEMYRVILRNVEKEYHNGIERFVHILEVNRLVRTMFQKANTITMEYDKFPMLVPPLPWHGIREGGFLFSWRDIIRSKDWSHPEMCHLEKFPVDQILPVIDSLNIIGTCAWKINREILGVILEVFENDGNTELDIQPPKSKIAKLALPRNIDDTKERKTAFKKWYQNKKDRANAHSLWCSLLYTLSIAKMMEDEVFWFPHNLDFRGRSYPLMPHFNYHGHDVGRGLLLFANGKPLGEKGLDWLKIHLINLTGLKKRSPLSERLEFANEIMDDILDSADYPLTGRKWWQESDEPWQTLACCKEVAAASRSEDPTQFISYLPAHQDGSCNGLQHYAALGRDQSGAESVNLQPSDVPQDVYTDVLELVENARKEDAENGVELAQLLEGHVKRKVIKQTVMTSVYGVTMYGAKSQIAKQILNISEFPNEQRWLASIYLAKSTFKGLELMFENAKIIQDWFTQMARGIVQTCKSPVKWIMPVGLPVIQPYFEQKNPAYINEKSENLVEASEKMLETDSSDVIINTNETDDSETKGANKKRIKFKKATKKKSEVVDRRNADGALVTEVPSVSLIKQRNGFPPNYIHSLDASHMMLTSLHTYRVGLSFVSVHDCYWTHACDVDLMNKICREQFIALHSQPLLENLSKELLEIVDKYLENNPELSKKELKRLQEFRKYIDETPAQGSFNLQNVLESTYFFS